MEKHVHLPVTGTIIVTLDDADEMSDQEVIAEAIDLFWDHDRPLDVFDKDIDGDGWFAMCESISVVHAVHEGGGIWYGDGPSRAFVEVED